MTKPTFPLICIAGDGALDLVTNEVMLSKTSALALTDPTSVSDAFLYDKNGNRWTYTQVADNFKKTWLTRMLAKTFYNPAYNVKVVWTLNGSYNIDELKSGLNNCIDMDDDIITQYEEAGIIKSAVNSATDFNSILKVLDKYVFAVDEEKLWKEQEGREK